MKWIGFLLAATACAGIGQWASSQIHRRVRLLESSMSLVEFLKARLSFTLAEPAVILQEWTQTSSIEDLPFPSACLCLYEQGMVFPSAWEESLQIRKAHQSPDFYMDVLKNKCKYQKVIVDTYWNPGSDNGRPADFGRLGKCSGKYRLTRTDRSAQSIAKPPEKSAGNGIAEIRDKWKVVSVFGTAGRASDGYFIMVKER